MNFVEAVKDLAGQYGMQVPEDDVSRPSARRRRAAPEAGHAHRRAGEGRRRLPQAPEDFAQRDRLPQGARRSGEIAKQFGLGYAPEGWRTLASVFPNYDDPLLAESGLVIVNEDEDKRYDRFRDRVMFPIRNVKGECIGFGGRVLGEGTPKYLNSPGNPGLQQGPRALWPVGGAQCAARAGLRAGHRGLHGRDRPWRSWASPTPSPRWAPPAPEHVQKLFRFTDSVVFSFDGDAAGRRAARKALDGALPYATDVRTVKFLFLPAEHDPDSYIREYGREAFARFVQRRGMPLSRFLIEASRGLRPEHRRRAAPTWPPTPKPLWMQLPEGRSSASCWPRSPSWCSCPGELEELWTGRKPAAARHVRQRTSPWRSRGGQAAGRPRRCAASP